MFARHDITFAAYCAHAKNKHCAGRLQVLTDSDSWPTWNMGLEKCVHRFVHVHVLKANVRQTKQGYIVSIGIVFV